MSLAGSTLALSGLCVTGSGCAGSGERSRVQVSRSGFMLDGRLHPVYSGSFHYWRHEVSLWPRLFDRLRRMGLNTVCTYIPWGVHEVSRGRFDFGRQDKRKNLEAFVKLADRKSFKVLLRPGPHINSEMTYFGYPARVLFDPEIAARTSQGTVEVMDTMGGQFPIPSYSSEKLYLEAGVYFDSLAPVIAPLTYPRGGPVIGIQADNEMSYFFRIWHPYSVDYHPQALELYRGWLMEKYSGDLVRLNRIYLAHYQSFDLVEPPRRFSGEKYPDLPPYMDWAEFRQWRIQWSLNRIARMFAERGLAGIPVFHCLPGGCRAPFSIPDVERSPGIDIDGINGYHDRASYEENRMVSRAAAGQNLFPFRPEFGGGLWLTADYDPRTPEDCQSAALTTLMHGVKGLNFYMAVERDRWLAAPVRADGGVRREYFDRYSSILRFLREMRFHEFEKQVEIILLFNHGLDRLFHLVGQGKNSPLSIPDELFEETVDFGFRNSPEACRTWMEQTAELLLDVGFDWNCGSTRLDAGCLSRYRVAVLPVGDFFYTDELAALKGFVQSGGTLLFGPGRPWLNQWMRRDRRVDDFFSGRSEQDSDTGQGLESRLSDQAGDNGSGTNPAEVRLVHTSSPLEVIRLLKKIEVSLPFSRSNKKLDLSIHGSASGRRLLFVANTTGKEQKSDIFFTGSHIFRSPSGGKDFSGTGKVRVKLGPYEIGVWEVS
ncbi:MAG: beta-galactosidase [Gemmatimonadota bacterium]|nr:beta-galactosidase [Gemmatimonadota bacterium]